MMMDSVSKLERNFHHPFEPYDIQKEFMSALYECLEDGKVGIFESPTGTGKSLSLICGSLTWLRDHKRQTFEEGLVLDAADDDEPDWILEHARSQKKEAALRRWEELEKRLSSIRAKEKRSKERLRSGEPMHKRRRKDGDQPLSTEDQDAQFVLDDYESDEDASQKLGINESSDSGVSAATHALMVKLGFAFSPHKEEDEVVDELKIFFCSRTHSQLTQFSNELRRVKIPPAFTRNSAREESGRAAPIHELEEDTKQLTLGSRKNLCINQKVNKLRSATAINERCLELQQSKTSADCKCPFMPTKDTESVVNDFRDHALAQIRDIEDLGNLGKNLGVCPYYASRPAIKSCEIVTLPYPLLLQKSSREALNISLKDHIVIIDEAHNLMDSIAGIHSISVDLWQFQQARSQLTIYLRKFRNKLKGKNRVYVAQTLRLLDSLITFLEGRTASAKDIDGIADVSELLAGKGVDQINLFKLNRYLQESKLARKVDGYTSFSEEEQQAGAPTVLQATKNSTLFIPRDHVPTLTHIQGFFLSLMNPSAEGRFFFSKDGSENIALKYMLLDPTFHFREIVEEARAVVLAGGTMSPMSDYQKHLLSYLPSSRIMTLSCGHVIPPSNLFASPVVRTLSGSEFDFTFGKRESPKMLQDLGSAILSFIDHIPDGVVVFFPSYSYLDTCVAAWERLGSGFRTMSLWDAISKLKPIFMEKRSNPQATTTISHSHQERESVTVDSILTTYSNEIVAGKGRGALLFAVIGGTLSEGINFSDALGRGIVVVGLPFPNPHSAEWKAKMQYITAKSSVVGKDGKAAAQDFYENACMRAVNQCVGRAIRHRGDYAAILMLDRRYGGQRIQAKLPGWIRGSLTNGAGIEETSRRLDEFFAGKS